MKRLSCFLLFGVSLVNINPAQAINNVINFDDIVTNVSGVAPVPSQYQNLYWLSNGGPNSGFEVIANSAWTGQFNYNNSPGAPSAPNGVLNVGIVTVSRVGGGLFTFKEAYFAPFTSNNNYLNSQGSTANTVTVRGYNGVNFVGSANLTFAAAGYVPLTQDIANITSLVITGTSTNPQVPDTGTRWAMDNFTYEPVAVPLESDAQPFVAAIAFFAVGTWWKKRSIQK